MNADITLVDALMTRHVITVASDDTVGAARESLDVAFVRHLPVVDDGHIVGIVSDRDLLRAASREQRIADVMTRDPQVVFADTPARDAVALMLQYRIHALPVVSGAGAVVGMITETDLLFHMHRTLMEADARE